MTLYTLGGDRGHGRHSDLRYRSDSAADEHVDVAAALREFLTLALWMGSALGLLVVGYGIIG